MTSEPGQLLGEMDAKVARGRAIERVRSRLTDDEWTVSQERVFQEELLVGRFNFFLVIFALSLGAAAQAKDTNILVFVFSSSLVMLLLFWIPLVRAYHKNEFWLEAIRNDEGNSHPAKLSHIPLNKNHLLSFLPRAGVVMAVWMPLCAFITLGLGLVLTIVGWLG